MEKRVLEVNVDNRDKRLMEVLNEHIKKEVKKNKYWF